MSYRIEYFENDSSWKKSIGEKLNKIHFRKDHWHAECDPETGFCSIHYDKDDPHESPSSLVKHLAGSNSGKVVIGVAVVALLDQLFNSGKLRKSITGGM